jgi:hypothetical protein
VAVVRKLVNKEKRNDYIHDEKQYIKQYKNTEQTKENVKHAQQANKHNTNNKNIKRVITT